MSTKSPDPRGSGIYTITHRESGRCYVGQSGNMPERWTRHRYRLRHNKHDSDYLQNTWNKYGEDAFDFQTVENCDVDDLTEREQFWMDELHPVFNIAPAGGSNRGFAHSAETRAKMSASAKAHLANFPRPPRSPEHQAKLNEANRGKKTSPEHRAKISAALTGRERSPEHCAKISAAKIGKPRPPGLMARLAENNRGRKLSPEHIAAQAAGRARAKAEREQDKLAVSV